MLLLFMEKEVHKVRCIPGASSIFGLLFIWLDADKVMLFGRRRVEHCKMNPWSMAEALLPGGHCDQRPHAGDSPRVPWGQLQQSVPVAEVLFLESTEFLPVWLILSQTCSAQPKIGDCLCESSTMVIFFPSFLVKILIFRICWAKTKLLVFVGKLRFVEKCRISGERHKARSQHQVPTRKIRVFVHSVPALSEGTMNTSLLVSYQLCSLCCGLTCLSIS